MEQTEKVEKVIRVPSELPIGWKKAPLAEVAEIIMGQSPPSKYYNADRKGLPFFQGKAEFGDLYPEPIKWCSEPSKVAQKDDILISVRAPVGPTNLAPSECCIGRGLAAIRPRNGIPSKYLLYYMRNIESSLDALGTGTTFKAISGKVLHSIPVTIAPPEQQKQIVAEIEKQFSRLDEAVANLKRVKANLKRYRAAVLKAAVEGKLTEEWRKAHPDVESASELLKRILAERRAKWNGRGKYKEPAPLNTEQLPRLPDRWAWATVEQLSSWLPGSIQSGPFGSHLLHSEFVSEGVLAIGIDNVGEGKFGLGASHRISKEKYSELRKFSARPRDVLITVMATVGRVCVLPENLEPAIVTKHCYRITPSRGGIDSQFLVIALRADAPTRWHIFGNLRGQTRPGINGAILKNTPVPLPPLTEQNLVVAEVDRRLSVVEELEVVVSANLQRGNRLRQAILQHSFSGKLSAIRRRLHERRRA